MTRVTREERKGGKVELGKSEMRTKGGERTKRTREERKGGQREIWKKGKSMKLRTGKQTKIIK